SRTVNSPHPNRPRASTASRPSVRHACARPGNWACRSSTTTSLHALDSCDGRNANCSDACSRGSAAGETQQPGHEFAARRERGVQPPGPTRRLRGPPSRPPSEGGVMTSAYADFIDELQQDVTIPIQPPMDDLAPGTRAVIYLRVSSTGQVRTDYNPEGISIPAQREACLRKARDLGVTVIDEYVEPGRSAMEMTKREAFQQMLARVRSQGDVD